MIGLQRLELPGGVPIELVTFDGSAQHGIRTDSDLGESLRTEVLVQRFQEGRHDGGIVLIGVSVFVKVGVESGEKLGGRGWGLIFLQIGDGFHGRHFPFVQRFVDVGCQREVSRGFGSSLALVPIFDGYGFFGRSTVLLASERDENVDRRGIPFRVGK